MSTIHAVATLRNIRECAVQGCKYVVCDKACAPSQILVSFSTFSHSSLFLSLYQVQCFSSYWLARKTAGGGLSCKKTFKFNPSVLLTAGEDGPCEITLFQVHEHLGVMLCSTSTHEMQQHFLSHVLAFLHASSPKTVHESCAKCLQAGMS